MDRHRIGVLIPALNEAATIAWVVSSASRYGVPIVVDDGSSDDTGDIATTAGARVVKHDRNRGYDQALNTGFAQAAELGCEYAITMDADGQHDPEILKSFVDALDEGAEVVIGTRNRRQRVAEHLFALVASAMWGIRDPMCGMKAYRISLYLEVGHFDSYSSIGTELALYAAKKRRVIVQIPVKTRPRTDTPRFGSRLSTNLRILHALLVAVWGH